MRGVATIGIDSTSLPFVAAIFVNKWITGLADSTIHVVGSTSRLFLAYLLLRLVRHFREVPRVTP